jgi:excisionase family DNA binding protein
MVGKRIPITERIPIDQRDYYFVEEVLIKCGITSNTLSIWIRTKKIPHKKPGRRVLFPKVEFDRWLARQRIPA